MQSAPNWIGSTQALIAALTALIVSIPPLIAAIRNLFPKREGVPQTSRKRRVWPWIAGAVGLCLFVGSLWVLGVRYEAERNLPRNTNMATAAWSAYTKNDFNGALQRAADCISTFGPQASMQQKELAAEGESLPAVGPVPEPEKSKILSRGILNDVGACLFVKAQAAEKLGRTKEALAAYQQMGALTYARVYDPNGFFWSPADAAAARLNGSQH
jgi:hypothetical protein